MRGVAISNPIALRPGRDADACGVIELIRACWSAYPGIVFDVDGEMPELRALASHYAGQGGALWVAEADGQIAGMIATRPHDRDAWEICRVYVLPSLHGTGLGHRLLDTAEADALAAGGKRLLLWSDTRFERAHHFYEKRSYIRQGPVRVLNDLSNSLEFAYAKPVNGTQALDSAAAASAAERLAQISLACCERGVAAIPHLRDAWRETAKDVALGRCVLVAGWHRGVLAAAGQLWLELPAAHSHRAELRILAVASAYEGTGLARDVMAALEQQAAGRRLLCGHAEAESALAALYHAEGWVEHGRLPGYAADASGELRTWVFVHKWIG